MKKNVLFKLSVIIVLAVSIFALKNIKENKPRQLRIKKHSGSAGIKISVHKPQNTTETAEEEIIIKLAKDGKLIEMPLDEYICCVVAAEMSVSYNEEALKAQAIASRTYTLNKMRKGGCNSLEGADICSSSKHCQAFAEVDKLRERWKDDFDTKFGKIKNAVESTENMVLTYDGKLISALYHSSSSGSTEDNENVYLNSVPYLISVSTPEEDVDEEKSISVAEIKKIMEENYKDFKLDDGKKEIYVKSHNSANRVDELVIGNVSISGKTARKLFSLRSTDFTLKIEDDTVIFKTQGHGHGVGMSQKGANEYAKNGMNFEEILLHYYPGTKLLNIADL